MNVQRDRMDRIGREEMSAQILPRVYDLKELREGQCEYNEKWEFEYPDLLPLNRCTLYEKGAICLLDDGYRLYLWVGKGVKEDKCYLLGGLADLSDPYESDTVFLN